jgi:putative transposase
VKRKRFAVEQITAVLKQAEMGTPVADLLRQHGVSEQSFHLWKKVYGGMAPSEARELKELREENVKLKAPGARPVVGQGMLEDVLQKKF